MEFQAPPSVSVGNIVIDDLASGLGGIHGSVLWPLFGITNLPPFNATPPTHSIHAFYYSITSHASRHGVCERAMLLSRTQKKD